MIGLLDHNRKRGAKKVNESWAKRAIFVMMTVCVVMAVLDTFIAQDMFQALLSISSFFVLKFAWKHPKVLTVTSYKEFGDVVDNLDWVSEITGTPAYFISVIVCVLYILMF